ncbi:hypothetical protein ACOSQ3_030844 [Xanthoceras sorbifolium]
MTTRRIHSATPRRQWSDLPGDILRIIFRKLKDDSSSSSSDDNTDINTIYRCGSVCVSWRRVTREVLPQFLLLSNVVKLKRKNSLFPNRKIPDYFKNRKTLVLFNLYTKRRRRISLPQELKGRWFTGSSFGWLLTIAIESPHEMHLINPFSPDQKIQLPDATEFRFALHIKVEGAHKLSRYNTGLRVITSKNPLDPNCIFVVTDGKDYNYWTPAFCRREDKYWTIINHLRGPCRDAIFYKDYFYFVDFDSKFVGVPVKSFVPITAVPVWQKPIHFHQIDNDMGYLVQLDGDLLLVGRQIGGRESKERKETVGFRVCKWNEVEKNWSGLERIGNNAILLGKYSSISIPVAPSRGVRVAASAGYVKPNCIYFIDDAYSSTHHDTGVYDMTNHHIDWFSGSWRIWKSPVNWLRPRFFVF